ncbi:MAG: hypothetical protein MJZ26_13035 [Fibrobacter sp.]|nr:hypothetical protein [Fibrobacter sp.]
MKFGLLKTFAFGSVIPLAVVFNACGDSSSSAPSSKELPVEVSTKDELRTYACNEDVKGEIVYVSEVETNYECNGEKWFRSEDQTKPSSSSAKSSSSGKSESKSSSSVKNDGECEWDFCWSKMSDKIACTQEIACTRAYYTPSDDVFLCDYDVDFREWGWYIYMDFESKKRNYCYNRSAEPKIDRSEYDPETNTLKDLRDDKTYKTLTVNVSKTYTVNKTEKLKKYTRVWMARDLSYKYGNAQDIYTMAQALDSNRLFKEVNPLFKRGICPKGWHIPSSRDFWDFMDTVGDSTFYANDKGSSYFGNHIAIFFYYEPDSKYMLNHFAYNLDKSQTVQTNWIGGEQALRCIMDYDPDDIVIDELFPEGIKEPGYYASNCPEGHNCKYATSTDYLNQKEVYGEFLDERDDQVYKTIRIGEQTWMAQNLNYADSVQTPILKGATLCGGGAYDSTTAGDCAIYGRRYTWDAATSGSVRGICPRGWHIPNKDEFLTLLKLIDMSTSQSSEFAESNNGGSYLKSEGGWGEVSYGENSYGFSVIPSGYYYFDTGEHNFDARFWSSTEYSSTLVFSLRMEETNRNDPYGKGVMLATQQKNAFSTGNTASVRCLKDSE